MELKDLEIAFQTKLKELADAVKKSQDTADNALEESRKEGTIHAKTSEKLTEVMTAASAIQESAAELKTRILDVEQKLAKRPGGADQSEFKTAGQLMVESSEFAAMLSSKNMNMSPVHIERKTIVNASGAAQPLVAADRNTPIVMPAQLRLTIRDILPQIRTSSDLVYFPQELVFTNSAAPQYDNTSPTAYSEGAVKAQSNITFQLGSAAVITLAHWLAASRQILNDAPMLSGYIDSRLSYGLKLEEESEIITGDGTVGKLTGLVSSATAFTGGSTNQTALDTLLKAMLQVSLSYYETSAFVLHPTDWTNIQLLKDTTGRYLFTNPQDMTAPRVWGKPVVVTPNMTAGTWLAGAFNLAAAIYDREDMSIRVSDQHQDFFTRNLVAILCEERLALAIYRATAIVTGNISYAG